jgi:hypothetical protein
LGWALLERLACPCRGRGEDIIFSDEGAGVEVDGCIVVEVNCHIGEFVLLGSSTNDIDINQFLELFGAKSRLELERSTQERLGDCERGVGI